MTVKQIPFSLERWKEGLKPVTRDGREVKQLTMFNVGYGITLRGVIEGNMHAWNEPFDASEPERIRLMLLEEVREPREWDAWVSSGGVLSTNPNFSLTHDSLHIGEFKPIKVREVLE